MERTLEVQPSDNDLQQPDNPGMRLRGTLYPEHGNSVLIYKKLS